MSSDYFYSVWIDIILRFPFLSSFSLQISFSYLLQWFLYFLGPHFIGIQNQITSWKIIHSLWFFENFNLWKCLIILANLWLLNQLQNSNLKISSSRILQLFVLYFLFKKNVVFEGPMLFLSSYFVCSLSPLTYFW